MTGLQVDLLLPLAFRRLGEWAAGFESLPELPELAALLGRARAERLPVRGSEATLLWCLDPRLDPAAELPAARRLHPEAACCADLVHLQADALDLRLLPTDALALAGEEIAALAAELNAHLAPQGLRWLDLGGGRGALAGLDTTGWRTVPPDAVAGGGVLAHLSRDPAAAAANRLFTELQMVLHEAPVNRAREARGALPANALWLWGAGDQPPGPPAVDALWSDDPLARRLGEAAGLAVAPLPARWADAPLPAAGRLLVVHGGLRAAAVADDMPAWGEAMAALCRDWLLPASRAVGRELRSLRLLAGDGRAWRWRPAARWRWWRRPLPLARLAQEAA